MNSRLYTFVASDTGLWNILSCKAICGEGLPTATKLTIVNGANPVLLNGAIWQLRGITSNERYTTLDEKQRLVAKQQGIDRPEANCAVLIPIRKNAEWWALTQDERRRVFEDQSHHTATGLKYVPAVARRLHHCRDLGENEPFDFLTYFEFAQSDTNAFDDLVGALRATREWEFVDREVELRLLRQDQK